MKKKLIKYQGNLLRLHLDNLQEFTSSYLLEHMIKKDDRII